MNRPLESLVDRAREVLDGHPVSFAMLFGSVARGAHEPRDLDLAVVFDDGIDGEGYSTTYLTLLTDLEETLGVDVDLVVVPAMDPTFARVAFDHGIVVRGTEQQKDDLASRYAGERPTVEEARERIGAAAKRLAGRSG